MTIDELMGCPLFKGMTAEQVRPLADFFDREAFDCGTTVFAQDALAERLYVLLRGHVLIRFKPYDGDLLGVTEIRPGGVFGWSAALGRRHYTSSAVCAEDSEVLSIRGSDLRQLCERYPETGVVILERLAEVIAERLRSTHEQVVDLLRVSMHSPRGDLPEL